MCVMGVFVCPDDWLPLIIFSGWVPITKTQQSPPFFPALLGPSHTSALQRPLPLSHLSSPVPSVRRAPIVWQSNCFSPSRLPFFTHSYVALIYIKELTALRCIILLRRRIDLDPTVGHFQPSDIVPREPRLRKTLSPPSLSDDSRDI